MTTKKSKLNKKNNKNTISKKNIRSKKNTRNKKNTRSKKNTKINKTSKDGCIIGGHASIGKGVLQAIQYMVRLGGRATQIFLGSNQSSSLKMKTKLTEAQIKDIKDYVDKYQHTLIVHAIYLINFCNFPSSSKQIKYAQDNLIHDLNMTQKIGGKACVLHLGYQKDLELKESYNNMIDNVKFCLRETNKTAPDVKILLETPAGKGSQIGTSLSQFADIWNLFSEKDKKRLGVCVDTAHIFSSGQDITTAAGMKQYIKDFEKLIGRKYLTLFHVNDSRAQINSRKDLHQGIGDGYIYGKELGGSLASLKELWKYSKKHHIAMILETHKGGGPGLPHDLGQYYQEIQLFNDWDAGKEGLNFKLKPDFPIPPSNEDENKSKTKTKNNTESKPSSNSKKTKKVIKLVRNNYLKFSNNKKIVDILNKLANYYQIKKDTIRKNSYSRAVYQLKKYEKEITSGKQVTHLEGIGDKIAIKIDEIVKTKHLKLLDTLKVDKIIEEYNKKHNSQNELLLVHGLGPAKVKQLVKEGITNLKELKDAVSKGKTNLTYQQELGVRYYQDLSIPVARAESEEIRDLIKKKLKSKFPSCSIELAGSYPSGTLESKDIDIIISTNKFSSKSTLVKSKILSNIVDYLSEIKIITHTLTLGDTKFMGLCKLPKKKSVHRHLDIIITTNECLPFARLYFSSGQEFNKLIRQKAKIAGYRLSEWGLYNLESGKYTKIDNKKNNNEIEKEIFKIIGTPFVSVKARRG